MIGSVPKYYLNLQIFLSVLFLEKIDSEKNKRESAKRTLIFSAFSVQF